MISLEEARRLVAAGKNPAVTSEELRKCLEVILDWIKQTDEANERAAARWANLPSMADLQKLLPPQAEKPTVKATADKIAKKRGGR